MSSLLDILESDATNDANDKNGKQNDPEQNRNDDMGGIGWKSWVMISSIFYTGSQFIYNAFSVITAVVPHVMID